MKFFTGLLGSILLICYLQEPSLAAPTDVKDQEKYTSILFTEYSCRIQKVADVVKTKLNVRD